MQYVERVLQDFLPAPPSFSSALPAGRSTDLSCSGISMSSKYVRKSVLGDMRECEFYSFAFK